MQTPIDSVAGAEAPSRRRVITAAAALGAGTLSQHPWAAASAQSTSLAPHRDQVKVAKVEAFTVPESIFVCVTADDGTTGWGEAGHDGGELTASVVNIELRPHVVGRDVFDGDPLWTKMYYETDELGPGGLASQAIAGVDCALWDLRGKLLGQPVWALLGGRHRKEFPVYGSFSIGQYSSGRQMTPKEAARKAEELVDEGFKAIKVRLGIREENADPDPDPAIPTVRAVRQAIGDRVPLYVDANNGYRAARAIEVGRRIAGEFNVSVFEEPVAAHHFASMAQVSEAIAKSSGDAMMTIAAGEHEYTPWAFRDLILHGKPGLLNPDVSKLSGLTAGKKVAALAEAFDLPMSVHNARPTLLTAAHAHFIVSSVTANRPQEHPGSKRLTELWRFFKNRIAPANGYLSAPETPGLGLEVDEAAVRNFPR